MTGPGADWPPNAADALVMACSTSSRACFCSAVRDPDDGDATSEAIFAAIPSAAKGEDDPDPVCWTEPLGGEPPPLSKEALTLSVEFLNWNENQKQNNIPPLARDRCLEVTGLLLTLPVGFLTAIVAFGD